MKVKLGQLSYLFKIIQLKIYMCVYIYIYIYIFFFLIVPVQIVLVFSTSDLSCSNKYVSPLSSISCPTNNALELHGPIW